MDWMGGYGISDADSIQTGLEIMASVSTGLKRKVYFANFARYSLLTGSTTLAIARAFQAL